MSHAANSFYITGGTMEQNTLSYVVRQADSDLYDYLYRGELCYVLTARQMGKSSLMVRTAANLREDGFTVVTLDLSSVGQNLTLEQWYYGLLSLTGRQLQLRTELREYWLAHMELSPLQRFMSALRDVVLPTLGTNPPNRIERAEAEGRAIARVTRLVLFIDEIDSVLSLPFKTDEFFAAIRESYNRRAEDPEMERLTFCLLGVASPSDLIQDPRTTPFNIGRRVELEDFTPKEAEPLALGLRLGAPEAPLSSPRVANRLLHRVLHWTNGHPYLTQRLCQAVAEDPSIRDGRGVDRVCRRLFLEPGARDRDDNLLFVQELLINAPGDTAGYIELYRRIRTGARVRAEETDPRVPILKLSGIAREQRGLLLVRNRIYYQAFGKPWIEAQMPEAEVRRQAAAYRRGLVRAWTLAGGVMAVLGTLAVTALVQTRRAERLLAEMQIDRGVTRLEAGENLGLLDLLEAYYTTRSLPDLHRSAALLWSGWYPTVRKRLVDVVGHNTPSTAVDFSRDGRFLASGAASGEIRVWDTATWETEGIVLHHPERVFTLAFHPDGRQLISHGQHQVVVWDRFTGKPRASFSARRGIISGIALRPDGQELACADLSGVRVYQAGLNWRESARLPSRGVLSLAYSPDGRSLVAGKVRGVEVWNVAGKKCAAQLNQPGGVECVRFLSRGRSFVAVADGQAYLWPFPPPKSAVGMPVGNSAVVSVAALPQNTAEMVSLEHDAIRFLNMPGGTPVEVPLLKPGTCDSLAVHPKKRLFAGSSLDGGVRIWGEKFRSEPYLKLPAGAAPLAGAWQADGVLAVVTVRGQLQWWDSRTGRQRNATPDPSQELLGAAFDARGERCFSWDTHSAWVRSAVNGSELRPRIDFDQRIRSAAVTGDGTTLMVLADDGQLRLISANASAPTRVISGFPLEERSAPVLAVSPNGRSAAVAAGDKLHLCNTSQSIPRPLALPPGERVVDLTFSPNSQRLACGGASGVLVWEVDRKAAPVVLGCPEPVKRVAFSPDGLTLVVAGSGSTVWRWDTRSWRTLGAPIELKTPVKSLAFNREGNVLITSEGKSASLRLWEVATGKPLCPALPHPDEPTPLNVEGNAGVLAAASDTGIFLWKALPAPPVEASMKEATLAATGAWNTPRGELNRLDWRSLRRLRQKLSFGIPEGKQRGLTP